MIDAVSTAPKTAGRRRLRTTLVLPAAGLGAAAVCGLVLLGIGTAQVGPVAVVVGIAAGLILLGPVLAAFLWIDRWEPEPSRLLVAAFAWGACIAALSALLINSTVRAVGDLVVDGGRGDVVAAVFSAPVAEEAVKGIFVLGVLLLRRGEFDGVIDGIVYAGVTAAGFAFTENIFYFGMAFDAGGLGDGSGGVVAAFMLRGVLSPFVHPLFTAITGIGIGVAASTRIRSVRIIAPLLGYLIAVGLHALWNGSAVIGGNATFLNFYFLVMVPIFVGVIWLLVWQRRREQRVVTRQLTRMVNDGLIAASEVGLLASQSGRRRWRAEVRREAGRHAARSVHRYQSVVTELAFLRHATGRRRARGDAVHRERVLIDELTAARIDAVRSRAEQEGPAHGVESG